MKIVNLIYLLVLLSISILEAQSFVLSQKFIGHESPVSFIAFRSEDNLIVSGDEQGQIIIWNIHTGKRQHILSGHKGLITDIAFSNNGNKLASASYDGTIRIWNLDDNEVLKVIKNTEADSYGDQKGNEPSFVVFAPDDNGVYYGGYNLEVLFTSLKNNQTQQVFSNNKYAITCGNISPDGIHLVIGYGNTIRFIELNNNTKMFEIRNPDKIENHICELAFRPEHNNLFTWTYGGTTQCWDLASQKNKWSLNAASQKGSSCMAFSGNGQFLVTGNFGNKTKLWNLSDQSVIQILGEHNAEVTSFGFSVDGDYIVTGSLDKVVNLWKRELPPQYLPGFELPEVDEQEDVNSDRNEIKEFPRSGFGSMIKPPRIVFNEDTPSPKAKKEKKEQASPKTKETKENEQGEGVVSEQGRFFEEKESRSNSKDEIIKQKPQLERHEHKKNEAIPEEVPIKDRIVETQHEIKVSGNRIELALWDNQKVDGDSISVNVNGEWVLSHYSLKENKKIVKVTFDKAINYVIVHAHNEGSISPNTLAISISDGYSQNQYALNSGLKRSAAIKILYDPKSK